MLAVNASELLRAYLLLFPESLQGCLHVLWPVVGYGAVRAARRSGVDVSVVDDLHLPAVLIRPIAWSDLILLDDWILAVLPIPVGTLVAGDVGVRLDERRHSVFGYELQALDLQLQRPLQESSPAAAAPLPCSCKHFDLQRQVA